MAFGSLIPWRPERELQRMSREIDRLWDSFLEGRPLRRGEMVEEEWFPSLDLSETKDDYIVKAEVPGIDPKDINITLAKNVLTIEGEKKEEKEKKEETYHFRERIRGSFSRSIQLPVEVGENIKATFKNGILKITLPKSKKVKPKEIKVEAEA